MMAVASIEFIVASFFSYLTPLVSFRCTFRKRLEEWKNLQVNSTLFKLSKLYHDRPGPVY